MSKVLPFNRKRRSAKKYKYNKAAKTKVKYRPEQNAIQIKLSSGDVANLLRELIPQEEIDKLKGELDEGKD